MFLAYIFQYLVQLYFLMLMIFPLLFLLLPIGGTSGLFSVFFLCFLTGQPGSACPSPSPKQNSSTGVQKRTGRRCHTPLLLSEGHSSTRLGSSDGSATGSHRPWRPPP